MTHSSENFDKEAKARAVQGAATTLAGAGAGASVGALAVAKGAALVSGIAASEGAAAGITGLTAHILGTPVWYALLITNPVTATVAIAAGGAIGGYAAYKLAKKIL